MGRMKAGDERDLLKIWNEEILIKDVAPNRNKAFASGFAAFAYKVLKGETASIHKLMDKLFANKQEVENKGNLSLTVKIKDYARDNDTTSEETKAVPESG